MKVLLIGGTGVLSSAITEEALNRGFEITMINRGRRKLPNGVRLVKADKSNHSLISKILQKERFDAVIDFLCYTSADLEKSFNFYSNYTQQYIFISSCAVYDKSVPGLKTEESPKELKNWKYSVEKWAAEKKLIELAQKSNCNYTIVRPCVTYDNTRIPYGIMPPYGYHWTLCARILAGKPIIRWNEGKNRSNMMRVEDFAVGLIGVIGNTNALNESYNICGDEIPTFNDVLTAIEKALNTKILYVDISSDFYAQEYPEKAGEILGGRSIDALNSNEKIKSIVPEFKQKIFLEEGILRTIDAYSSQNFQRGIDWKFDANSDRIISNWCKSKKLNIANYKLGFIDYLKNASLKDKITYKLQRHKDNFIVKIFILVTRITKKINRMIRKLA